MNVFFIVKRTFVWYNVFGDTMRIKKIKKIKNGKYKLLIDGDNEIVTYDEVILKNNLLNNRDFDKDVLLKINADTGYYNIYNKVVNYIQTRLRSEKEIIHYLKKFELNEDEKSKIINQLKTSNFLNDLNFAKAFIADKINLSNFGPEKIKRELYDHNIDEHVIDNLIASVDHEVVYEKLHHLINKKIVTNKKNSKYQLKSKILNNFISLGYSSNMINEIFDELFIDDDNIINKEYKKLYEKLKRKHCDDELYLKIKQKLYQKGFVSDEINEVIKENYE